MITFIIRGGIAISNVTNMIKREISTASNIKDKNNRKEVIESLHAVDATVKNYKNKIPVNGLAVYCGHCI